MDKKVSHNKRILYLFIVFLLSAVMAVCSACDEFLLPTPNDPSVITDTPAESVLPIKNGDFKNTTRDSGDYPRPPKDWTQSFEGSSEKAPNGSADAKYGVINVKEGGEDGIFDKPENLVNLFPLESDGEGGYKKDGGGNYLDKGGNVITIWNPGKPAADNFDNVKDEDKPDNDNILMLRNITATSQKYRSPSITIPAKSYHKITFYLYTKDIKNNIIKDDTKPPEEYEYGDAGANFTITGFDNPVYLRNLVSEKNKWTKYTIYVEGSDYQSKTIYLEFSLGYGYDTSSNINYLATGYAFFDNVNIEHLSLKEYKSGVAAVNNDFYFSAADPKYEDKEIVKNCLNLNVKMFGYSALTSKAGAVAFDLSDIVENDRPSYKYSNGNVIKAPADDALAKAGIYNRTNPYFGYDGFKNAFNPYDKIGGYENDKDPDLYGYYPFASDDILFIENIKPTSKYALLDSIKIPEYKYYKISVFVKTSEFSSGTGAGIYLLNNSPKMTDSKYSICFENINTTLAETIKGDYDKEAGREDILKARGDNASYKWENWVEYTFYVQGSPYDPVDIQLMFTLGNQDVLSYANNPTYYTSGWAAFANLTTEEVTYAQYSSASSSNSRTDKLFVESTSTIANGNFNAVIETDSYLEKRPSMPKDWTGVAGGDKTLGFTDESKISDASKTKSGVVNANFVDPASPNYKPDYEFKFGASLAAGWYNNLTTGPNVLMIYNSAADAGKNVSYGYYSNTLTLSANSYTKISVLVKTMGGAKASIYLVDMDTSKVELDSGYVFDDNDFKKPLTVKADINEDYDDIDKILAFEGISTIAGDNNKTTPELIDYGNGWMQYSFYIATGSESKTYRLELFNGTRDNSVSSSGYVFFDNIQTHSYTKDTFSTMLEFYEDELGAAFKDSQCMYKRDPVKLESETDKEFEDFKKDYKDLFKETVAFVKSDYTIFADYNSFEFNEREEPEEDDTTTPPDENGKTEKQKNLEFWLLISSLLMAIALIIAVGAVVFRRVRVWYKKRADKHGKVKSVYDMEKKHFTETDDLPSDIDDTDIDETTPDDDKK